MWSWKWQVFAANLVVPGGKMVSKGLPDLGASSLIWFLSSAEVAAEANVIGQESLTCFRGSVLM